MFQECSLFRALSCLSSNFARYKSRVNIRLRVCFLKTYIIEAYLTWEIYFLNEKERRKSTRAVAFCKYLVTDWAHLTLAYIVITINLKPSFIFKYLLQFKEMDQITAEKITSLIHNTNAFIFHISFLQVIGPDNSWTSKYINIFTIFHFE